MFILQESRGAKLANQLYRVFLDGFDQASAQRDHRADLADNVNPVLKASAPYFTRLAACWAEVNQEVRYGLGHYRFALSSNALVINNVTTCLLIAR